MIKNYITVALRNLLRHKFFSFINIFGLAVSMSICLGIIMLVADQMMYDRYNSKRDRIYRVISIPVNSNGIEDGGMKYATSAMPLRHELEEKYTGVEEVVRLKRGFGNNWSEFEGQNVNIPLAGFFADPEVFVFFEYELQYGDPVSALSTPYSVVLTRKAANKLFKEENPLGLTIKVGDIGTYTVTGVLKETKRKSHIVFEALASMSTTKSLHAAGKFGNDMENWSDFWNGWTYVLLEDGRSPADIQLHLEKIYQEHKALITNPNVHRVKFNLQSLKDITPGREMSNAIGPSLPWIFVYFLSGLAGVIMVTSCFNFTNLSIGRSLTRAREIGIRKVSGAARRQIFTQFLSESVVVALCALLVAFSLLLLIEPLMQQLTLARVFKWDLEANYVIYGLCLVFAVTVGILAGFFPAAVLSAFQPIKVLKGLNNIKLFSRMALRKALLVSQFTISLIFILTVIVVYNQLNLFMGKDHGFNMKNNIMVQLNNTSYSAMKTELLKYSNIQNVTGASHVPASGTTRADGFKKNLDEKEWTNLNYFVVDEDYTRNIEIELIAGKFFASERGESNKNFIVINEEAVRALHYKTSMDALGEEIIYQRDSLKKTIIGVVRNYNHQILLSKIEPMALMYSPDQLYLLQVRYSGTYEDAAKSVEKAWATINPRLKIDYKDFESEIKMFYDTIFGDVVNILGVIAFLAIMISCMGLLGMATYMTETRMKEISIRKVLGSSNKALVYLLSKGFLSILAIAVLTGVPATYFLNTIWLEMIPYHVNVDLVSVALGVFLLVVFGVITIGSQTWRATFVNPVDNLKNE